jgi:hypothetical protein
MRRTRKEAENQIIIKKIMDEEAIHFSVAYFANQIKELKERKDGLLTINYHSLESKHDHQEAVFSVIAADIVYQQNYIEQLVIYDCAHYLMPHLTPVLHKMHCLRRLSINDSEMSSEQVACLFKSLEDTRVTDLQFYNRNSGPDETGGFDQNSARALRFSLQSGKSPVKYMDYCSSILSKEMNDGLRAHVGTRPWTDIRTGKNLFPHRTENK